MCDARAGEHQAEAGGGMPHGPIGITVSFEYASVWSVTIKRESVTCGLSEVNNALISTSIEIVIGER